MNASKYTILGHKQHNISIISMHMIYICACVQVYNALAAVADASTPFLPKKKASDSCCGTLHAIVLSRRKNSCILKREKENGSI